MGDSGSTMQSFYKYDTTRHIGFNEELLSNLERILLSFRNSPLVSGLCKFYDNLNEHLASTNPHQLDISEFDPDILGQMYDLYQSLGYTGTVEDMLKSLIKSIPAIADPKTIGSSAARHEAVNVEGWKKLLDIHNRSRSAHKILFDLYYLNEKMFYTDPSWEFCYMFKELYDSYIKDGYTLTSWNPQEGTLFFEFTTVNMTGKVYLFTIYLKSETISFFLEPSEQYNNRQCLHIAINDAEVVSPLMTSQTPYIDRGVFIYDNQNKRITWRTEVESGTIEDIVLSTAVYMKLNATLQETCSINHSAVMRFLTYYPKKMDTHQTLIFL